jgi:hypothetical protein
MLQRSVEHDEIDSPSSVEGDIGGGAGTTTHTWTDQYLRITHSVSGASFRAAGS